MRRSTILYLAAGLVPVAGAAVGPHLGELRGTLGLSAEWSVDGDLYTDGGSALDDLGILGPDYAGETGAVEIRGASYSDAYEDPALGVQAELTYGVSENVEIYAALGWTRAGGNTIQMGDLIPDSTGERLPLYASFEDLNTYSGEVGARYYFGYDNFRPFVGANVGAAYVEEIRLGLSAPDAGVLINDLAFYDATTVFTAGIEAGLAFGDGANLSGSVSVGAKYMTALDGNDSDISSYGIGAIAEGSERIVVPIKGNLTLSF